MLGMTRARAGIVARMSGALCLAIGAATTARAQAPADFYAGKTIEIYVGSSVGAGYDIYARLLARHISRFIPGHPTIVVRNMDGGGGLRVANWVYNVGARDGLVIGTFGRGIAFDPLLKPKGTAFEARKFGWLGSLNNEVSACLSWGKSDVRSIADAQKSELVVGASGTSGDTYVFPTILNAELGTKMKIITGYPGGNEISMALDRGEVQGRCGWSYSSMMATHGRWLKDGTIHILAQVALSKHPDLPDVPLAIDLAKTDEQRDVMRLVFARQAMAWPFATPPGVPQDRLDALRKAFDTMVVDPEFLADAEKGNFEIRPVSGIEIDHIIDQVYHIAPEVARRTADLLQ